MAASSSSASLGRASNHDFPFKMLHTSKCITGIRNIKCTYILELQLLRNFFVREKDFIEFHFKASIVNPSLVSIWRNKEGPQEITKKKQSQIRMRHAHKQEH